MSTQTHHIDWPADYDRTDPDDREAYPGNISLNHRRGTRALGQDRRRDRDGSTTLRERSEHPTQV
ncbi:hypothetical protein [Halostagnicola kamekurae]|uniref:hypothetical protein n=1 Tax=Halostagnicola kamekurae TaxID=619731 RepID=UPI001113BCE7|nr:hypothetical protein [Halostagnicola kamekurae]